MNANADITAEIAESLSAFRDGDASALRSLATSTYAELRRLAHAQLGYGDRLTLNTTGLVNEWYLRMAAAEGLALHDRKHFFVLAAKIMRQVICGYARERTAVKRGAGERPLPIDAVEESKLRDADRFIELDHAMERLAAHEPRLAQVVELRFFGGLSEDDTAAAMETSLRSVQRLWVDARARLLLEVDPT